MKFTETHEWIRVRDKVGVVGITNHARSELGEIVFVQLPKVGQKVEANEEVVILESTKAAADIYSPCSGEIVAVNQHIADDPFLLNSDPEKEGWLFTIALHDPHQLDGLLDHEQYGQLIS